MKKIFGMLNMVLIITLLMIAGLGGYLLMTGRIDKEKAQTIMDLLRHQGTPAGLRNQVYAVIDPTFAATATASAPASEMASRPTGALAGDGDAPSASERLEYTRQAIEQERLRLERDAQDLQHRQQLLDQQRAAVEAAMTTITAKQKAFDDQQKVVADAAKSDAFTRSLDLYNELKTKQLKDLFITMDPGAVADFIKAMETDRAAKVIAEFKTPEEKTFIASVLERIRNPVADAGTANATQPAVNALSPAADASAAK